MLLRTWNVALFALLAVTDMAVMLAASSCRPNCSPSKFRAVTIMDNFPPLKRSGIRKHKVFPDPVDAVLMISCMVYWECNWAMHSSIWNKQGGFLKTASVCSRIWETEGACQPVSEVVHIMIFHIQSTAHSINGATRSVTRFKTWCIISDQFVLCQNSHSCGWHLLPVVVGCSSKFKVWVWHCLARNVLHLGTNTRRRLVRSLLVEYVLLTLLCSWHR